MLVQAGTLRIPKRFNSDVFIIAGVVPLIQFMASAEFRSDGIPQQAHGLYPVFRIVAVRAAQVFIQVTFQFRHAEVRGVGIQVNQAAGDHVLDQFLGAGIGYGHQHPVYVPGVAVRHFRSLEVVGHTAHGIRQGPEQVAPDDHFTDGYLHPAKVLGAGNLQGLHEQPGDEIKLYRKPGAAVKGEGIGPAGGTQERAGRVQVLVNKNVFPAHQGIVQDQDGIVLIQAAG